MPSSTPRYLVALLLATAVLLAGSLAVSWLSDIEGLPSWLPVAASVVPVAGLLAMFWIHGRYVLGLDEYLRLLHCKALLVATAFTLGLSTAWGYLEMFAGVPVLAVYWLNPVFWIINSIAYVGFSLRDTTRAS